MDLNIVDSSGSNFIQHMDGQEPSGFTCSNYTGMNSAPANRICTNPIKTIVSEKKMNPWDAENL